MCRPVGDSDDEDNTGEANGSEMCRRPPFGLKTTYVVGRGTREGSATMNNEKNKDDKLEASVKNTTSSSHCSRKL